MKKTAKSCKRCESHLENGFCTDETCPFENHWQSCQLGWTGHPKHPTVEGLPTECTCHTTGVRATCYSDDHLVTVHFDAVPYLKTATDIAIVDIFKCGFGGDYAADHCAEFFEKGETKAVFDHTHIMRRNGGEMGFECNLEQRDVLHWVQKNRPSVLQLLKALDLIHEPA